MAPKTIFLNFSHPLSEGAAANLRKEVGEFEQIDVQVNLDIKGGFAPQLETLLDNLGLAPQEWETSSLVVQLPAMAPAAALALAGIAGRAGHLPRVIRLVRTPEGVFELGEVIDLQGARERARMKR